MDFIFGTLATDDLKLIHHRTYHSGLQHAHRITPQDPQPDDPITLTVWLGPDIAADRVVCYYTRDGSQPQGARGLATNGETLSFEHVDTFWDTLRWGYIDVWRTTLPPQPEGTVIRYRIGARCGEDGAEYFADWPDVKRAAEEAATAFFRDEPLPPFIPDPQSDGNVFTLHIDRFTPPQWARHAVIYHIFVDRFYPGDGHQWLPAKALNEYHGGTLWGVRDKLDYIAELGATCIWLSPTFVCASYHGYDVIDYKRTNPQLGGDDALRALIEAAHARGIRVLLDLACNHISDQHPIFQEALHNPQSPYHDWFIWDDSPLGYRAFFGVKQMPEVNLQHPAAREWFIDIGRYWLREFAVDGYRLDHANGPGPDFWGDFRAACRAENPDCFVFGEVVDAPEHLRAYIGRLDGNLDFITSDMLRRTFGYRSVQQAAMERFLERHFSYFPSDYLLPTFLDNHDMDRFLFIAGGDKDALKQAAAYQMQLPNPPIIYYGTEVGLSQAVSGREGMGLEQGRLPMLWGDDQDADLLAFYKRIIRNRQA